MMPVKILIADDHRLFRAGLRGLLSEHADLAVVGETTDGLETVAEVARLKPDVVLMDIAMPGLNGIEATRRIVAPGKGLKVIIVSMHADRRYVLEALRAGAAGYLLKDCALEEVLQAIRAVRAGSIFLARQINDAVVRDYVEMAKPGDGTAFGVLSAREREVVRLLAEGRSTREAATRLGVSVKTVEGHRAQIMQKLGIRSLAELTKYAIREGLTSAD
jgi:DNA-binding NarL/FixJ family response regulator